MLPSSPRGVPWQRLGAVLVVLGLGGSSNLSAPRAFGYGGIRLGPFGINGGASTSRTAYNTQRPIVITATVPTISGEQPLPGETVNTQAASDQIGVTRDTWTEWKDTETIGTYKIDGKVGWRRATYDRNPFIESGAAAASLVGLADTLVTKESDVDFKLLRQSGKYRPLLQMPYRRELGDDATAANMQLGDLPAGRYLVNGVPIPRDQYHLVAGLTLHTDDGTQYTLEYETLQATGESHQGVHLRVRFK